MIELLSIDLSNYCSKQCPFCYNHSTKDGNVMWKPDEVIAFATDCVNHGVKAVSLGGGEPFEYDGIFDVIDAIQPLAYLSVTTNGLPLMSEDVWATLMSQCPDKIHITIHNPDSISEVKRVINQIERLKASPIKPGVNFLVAKDKLEEAKSAYCQLRQIIDSDQIILVPQRFSNTPTPKELADVACGKPFQSPSCLLGCQPPKNFCSVAWDKKANYCSYAGGKEKLETLDFFGLMKALNNINFKSCVF